MISEQRAQVNQALQQLPEHIQKTINEFPWAQETMSIGQHYGLSINQIDVFQLETLKVLVGLVRADQYQNQLRNLLGLPKEEAGQLVAEANNNIFSPLQKRAFSNPSQENNHNEKEFVEHGDLASMLDSEGITLIDELTHVPQKTEFNILVAEDSQK